jgi:hypothetical protein
MDGFTVCRHHGAKGGRGPGPRVTEPGLKAAAAALSRRRADKALGLSVPPRGRKAKLKAVLAQQIAALPVIDKPVERMSQAELLSTLSRRSLLNNLRQLDLPSDPEELKAMGLDPMKVESLKSTVANTALNVQVKIDEASLRHVEHTDKIDILMQKLRAVKMPTE